MFETARRAWFFPAAAVVIALAVALQWRGAAATFAADRVYFPDPDDYTRCFRARLILTGQAGVIRELPQINVPRGLASHWTAPMDWLIVAPAWLLGGLIRHPDPLGCVAACVPIALGVVYLAAYMLLLRRGFGDRIAVAAGLLAACSPGFQRAFALGHCDHHGLLELLLWIGAACWIPRRSADLNALYRESVPSAPAACISGLAIGAAIWVASEALLTWGLMACGIYAAAWLTRDSVSRAALAARRRVWGLATLGVVAFAHVLENWPGLLSASADRVSLIQIAMVAVAAAVPVRRGASERTPPPALQPRLQTAVEAAAPPAAMRPPRQLPELPPIAALLACAALAVWLIFDRERLFADVARQEVTRWHRLIFELQPLVSRMAGQWSLRPMVDQLGLLPFALPPLAVAFWRSPRVSRATAWMFAPLALAIGGLTVLQRRWIDHESLATLPVALIGMAVVAERLAQRWFKGRRADQRGRTSGDLSAAALTAAGTLVLCGSTIATVLSDTSARQSQARAYQHRTAYAAEKIIERERGEMTSDVAGGEHAEMASRFGGGDRAILCEDGEGPLLLYWTGLPVVAAPYHRGIEGILAAASFYAERDERRAADELRRLSVRYVVVPARAHEQLMNFETVLFGAPRSFDPPIERIESDGSVRRTLRYRPGFEQTMAYRLVVEAGHPPAGLTLIASVRERSDRAAPLSGLLYETSRGTSRGD